jgi:hypothetical protein
MPTEASHQGSAGRNWWLTAIPEAPAKVLSQGDPGETPIVVPSPSTPLRCPGGAEVSGKAHARSGQVRAAG